MLALSQSTKICPAAEELFTTIADDPQRPTIARSPARSVTTITPPTVVSQLHWRAFVVPVAAQEQEAEPAPQVSPLSTQKWPVLLTWLSLRRYCSRGNA